MALTDGQGLPISVDVTSASPHESKLAEETFNKKSISRNPKRLIADKAYDSKKLRRAFSKNVSTLLFRKNRMPRKRFKTGENFEDTKSAGKSRGSSLGYILLKELGHDMK
jgi:transposase